MSFMVFTAVFLIWGLMLGALSVAAFLYVTKV